MMGQPRNLKCYKIIALHDIQLFIRKCEACHQKQEDRKIIVVVVVVVKPLISPKFNNRCQVDATNFKTPGYFWFYEPFY